MAEVTWKDLAKAIDDLTKISDEIDSKLVTHNTDESAHSQSNEAIYNHRVGVILDHLDGSVTALKIKDLAVETGKIKDLAVETAKIAALAVETAKIAALAVTTAKIDDLAVDSGKIKDLAVETAKIAALAVTTAKIDDLAVDSAKIKDLSVETAKIKNLAVETIKIKDGATTGIKLAISGKVADAIVAASGGDYTDIQSAIDAGKKAIFIKRGTYSLDADINIPSDVSIFGEDKYDTIIDLNGDHQIKSVGDTPYTTGTITATIGSAVIVGSGTLWLANLAVNDFIVFNGACYKITAVTDDTHVTIEIVYKGRTESAISYNTGTFLYDVDLSNFTVSGQDISAIKGAVYFYGVVKSNINNVIVKENDLVYSRGIYLYRSFNNTLSNIIANNNGYNGIKLKYSDNNTLSNIVANNNNNIGLELEYSDNSILSNIIANNNNSDGIYFNHATHNTFSNIIASNNNNDGFEFFHGDHNTFSNIIANNNLSNGINLGSNSDHNAFSNMVANKNGADGIHLSGSFYNTLSNIVADNNTDEGVQLYAAFNNILSDIVANDNGDDGVNLYNSKENTLSNIFAEDNGDEGVKLSGSDKNTLLGIVSKGNDRGIYLYDSDSNVISGHSVIENKKNGIRFYRSSYNVISNGIVRDSSQITHAAWSEIHLADDGATYSTYNIITGNNIRCTLAKKAIYGIRENAAGDNYNLVHGNIVQGAVTAQISLQGANSVNADNI